MIANSKKQTLAMHSLGVANVALKLFQNLQIPESSPIKKTFENLSLLEESVFFAGLFHDIGKIDPNFQSFLEKKEVTENDGVHYTEKKDTDKFSFLNYPRHNEISWAIATHLLNSDVAAQYAIYYHHAQVQRLNKKTKVIWNKTQILDLVFDDQTIVDLTQSFFEQVEIHSPNLGAFKEKFTQVKSSINSLSISSTPVSPPGFLFSNVTSASYVVAKRENKDIAEIKNLLVRSLVVSADRIVSSLSVKDLEQCIEFNEWDAVSQGLDLVNDELAVEVKAMIERFALMNANNPINRERDSQQADIAKRLSEKSSIATLFGPAGCGKTKIFLEWYANKVAAPKHKGSKKLFIIAPRKMICSSLFNELRSKDYISNAKIELLTGDDKLFWNGENISIIEDGSNLVSDITITTIDQLISVMLSHKKVDMLLEFLNSYVVFDEFHEFFNISGIVVLFKFFITLKMMLDESKTLLVSATPNYFFLEDFLKVKASKSVEYIDTFNKEPYRFVFDKYNIQAGEKNQIANSLLYKKQEPGSIVIFNTAKASQDSTICVSGEDVINFHSKFTPEDRKEIYDEILKNWKAKDPACGKVLRAGPIVQASLNISTMNLLTQPCAAENWLQRVGRANRFASKTNMATVHTVLSDKTLAGETTNNPEMNFLDRIAAKEQSFAWLSYFAEKNFIGDELSCITSLSALYEQYREFHSLPETKQAYANDFEKIIAESLKIFEANDFTPVEFWKKPTKAKKAKMSSKSIRGLSVYVLPARYDIYEKKIGDWLYYPDEDTEPRKLLTLSEQELMGKDTLFNNQIQVLSVQKLNGFANATYEAMKKYNSMNSFKIKLEAKNSTSPLLLSYTESVPNHKAYNQSGLFYVTKGKVKVGLFQLSIN